jgi:integrin beta 3
MLDGAEFGKEIVDLVRGFVEREFAPLRSENAELKDRIAALEARSPEKGEKGDPGERGEPGQNGKDGATGAAGKDAANIVEALKDSGELVLTLQDGRLIRTGIRDGDKGQDGRDGFGFDDMDVCVLDDDRTIELSFKRGEEEKVFTLKWPTVIDRGVFKHGETYQAGDAVTWGGSLWIAQKETGTKPDTPDSGFRLAVKRGRDGKDAKVG